MNQLTENFGQVTSLDVHSFDYSMELWSSITENLWLFSTSFIGLLETLAELSEIFACLWANIIEKFDNYLRVSSCSCVDVHVNIASSWSVVDSISKSISGLLSIDEDASLIGVSVLLKSPLNERFFTADVDGVVYENNWASLMLIKVTFEVILESFQI